MLVVHNGRVCVMVNYRGKWLYIPERKFAEWKKKHNDYNE